MARKNCLKFFTKKLLIVATLVLALCCSAFSLFACGEEEATKNYNDGTYSDEKVEVSKSDVTNPKFEITIEDDTTPSYPVTTVNGWSKSADSASASSIDSGVISIAEEDWDKVISNFYDKNAFNQYLEREYNYQVADIKALVNADSPNSVTSAEVKNYVLANTATEFITSPGKYSAEADNYVYMLNNYISDGSGTAQKVSSENTITIESGKTYEVSVWVKVLGINGNNPSGDFGACIRLENSINGNAQAEFRLTNIKANGTENNGWTKYSVYIVADEYISGNFKIVLGLGLGNKSSAMQTYFTEGTVLFDDVSFKELSSDEVTAISGVASTPIVYGSSTPIALSGVTTAKYDMNVNFANTQFTVAESDFALTASNQTNSDGNAITSKTIIDAHNAKYGDTLESKFTFAENVLTLTNASATLKVTNSAFKLNANEYMVVSFDMKTNLKKNYSTNVVANLEDTFNGATVNRARIATLASSEDGEWQRCSIMIKNNFENVNDRTFALSFVFGPDDLSTVNYLSDLANGTIEFKNFSYTTPASLDEESYTDGVDDLDYKKISFYQTNAKATVALYAGYNSDASNVTDETSYDFVSAPSEIGAILTGATTPKGYTGIETNHAYLSNEEGKKTAVNDRNGNGNDFGIAGLVNTKYISTYATNFELSEETLKNALNHKEGDEYAQRIMIYNATENAYGYIGSSLTINSSAYAKVSVTLRVLDNAKAYIYIVDTADTDKHIMEFADFTVNTDIIPDVAEGTAYAKESNKLFLTVDKNMMNTEGWATVDFYIATGATAKDYRLEIWNGARNGSANSQGFVVIDAINIQSDNAFSLTNRWADSFSYSESPLFNVNRNDANNKLSLIAYKQELLEVEKEFNKEYPAQAISYYPGYVWAKNNNMIMAVYSSIDPVVTNPYDAITEEEETETGCAKQTDPATFWLSFSSIVLGVVLVLAVLILFIKNLRRSRKYYKEDKANFKIQSKTATHKRNQEKLKAQAEKQNAKAEEIPEEVEEISEETAEEITEEVVETEEASEKAPEEQDLDSYVYGDVQQFGEEQATDAVKTEEASTEPETKE